MRINSTEQVFDDVFVDYVHDGKSFSHYFLVQTREFGAHTPRQLSGQIIPFLFGNIGDG